MTMSDKLYVKTRHPKNLTTFVKGELVSVKSKEEIPNVYELQDGTTIYVHLDLDSVSFPIDSQTGDYFRDETGEKLYSIDYHVRVIVSKPSQK